MTKILPARPQPASTSEFSIAEARRIVYDLFQPNPKIYWLDLLTVLFTGHALFPVAVMLPTWMPEPVWLRVTLQVLSFTTVCLCYYRASLFIHELAHLPSKHFRFFRWFWNYFCGTRMLLPAFLYDSHTGHHRRKFYGTKEDGEYIPFERRSRSEFILYFLQPFVAPILGVIRFFLITPLTWFSPALRKLVHERASSLIVNTAYVRPMQSKRIMRSIRRQEIQCFNTCLVIALVLVFYVPDRAWAFLLNGYLTAVVILMLNHTRSLASHRWTGDENEMTFVEQMLDSANYARWPLTTALWAPVGTRFHALHHLFPSMPYHNLAIAHQRLMDQLPANSVYRQTEVNSMFWAMVEVWQRTGRQIEVAPAIRHEMTEKVA